MKIPTLCIDPGHGGHDSGAVGPDGLRESDVVLEVCLQMAVLLQGLCSVVMTRADDRFITLSGRAAYANAKGADLFLSVHCNSGPPGQGAGFEVWTSPGQTESDRAAGVIFESYADRFPMKTRRSDTSDGDVDKESKFSVLMLTRMPAVLFELEFIHTQTGQAWLTNKDNISAAAEALAEGVLNYFGIPMNGLAPEPEPPAAVPEPDLEGVMDRMQLRMTAAVEAAKTELMEMLRK